MEMSAISRHIAMVLRSIWVLLFVLLVQFVSAQQPGNFCKVKDGKFFIQLQKNISNADLNIFTDKYDLYDLPLKEWLAGKKLESIKAMGWELLTNDASAFAIAKKLETFAQEKEKAAQQKMAEVMNAAMSKDESWAAPKQIFGINKYKRRNDFAVRDSVVTFYLRGETRANKVLLAGSFTKWQQGAFPMKKTDSGWIAHVILPEGKHWYKFIVDGQWQQDPDNLLLENDGRGNTNSVYYKTNTVFRLAGYAQAKKVYVAGSFNNWIPRRLEMVANGNGWSLPMYLPAGTHTYRYVVNNEWMADPGNKDRLPNEFNDYNSVVRIGKPYVFKLDGYANAKKVVLTGSFNNWRKDELYMKKQSGGWVLPYHLGPGNHEYKYIVDDEYVSVPVSSQGETQENANLFFVLQPNYTFRLKGFENARKVVIAGDFNQWSENTYTMRRVGNEWILDVHLSPGKHRYKFLVDGKWMTDPANKQWEQNEHGTGNSVIWFETPAHP